MLSNFIETLLLKTQPRGVTLVRLHDATSFRAGFISKNAKNPCDFIGSVKGIPHMIECKETDKERIPPSVLLRPKSKHQFDAMLKFTKDHENNRAGYLVHLGALGRVVWVPVQFIMARMSIGVELIGSTANGLTVRQIDSHTPDWFYLFLGEE